MTGVEDVPLSRASHDSSSMDRVSPCKVEEELSPKEEELVTEGALPIQIVVANNDDHKFELDAGALEKILMQDHIKDLNVVVLSVAGAFRKGKSFLLDFMLRYMHTQVCYMLMPLKSSAYCQ